MPLSWDGQCVIDSPDRLLPIYKNVSSLTPSSCVEACTGYLFAGVQYGKECWCGYEAPPKDKIVPMNECDYACTGDSALKCGGYWRMNVTGDGDMTRKNLIFM